MIVVHRADVVVPVTAPPIPDGAVAVEGEHIVAVGPVDAVLDRVRATAHEVSLDDRPGLLLPGLVNAHTHLQYTSFADVGATPFPDYTAWSIRFVEEYDRRVDDDWVAGARAGLDEVIASGTTCVGDVVTDWAARDVLVDAGVPGVAYLELIGTDLEAWDGGVGEALHRAVSTGRLRGVTTVGISPHAPYSVEPDVIIAMVDMARTFGVRLHIHVGESDGEDEFYRSGTGSLAERVRQVASRRIDILERGGTGLSTAEYVQSLGAFGPDCHIAHGVYLGQEGRAIVASEGTVVALCPRSNAIVGIDAPPVADYLDEDVPFAVGTDSLGSSPSLDLMDDVAALAALASEQGYRGDDLDRRLLWAATMGGATGMGLADELGSLEIGKRADLCRFDLELDQWVRQGAGRCTATFIGGVERSAR